jgi:hypothetical protein
MKTIPTRAIAVTFALAVMTAFAQQPAPAPAPGPGAGPAPGASQRGPGMGMGPRWGADVTHGWSMMTPQERAEHQSKMQSMKTYDECAAYRDQHHKQMLERAKAKGGTMPDTPRRDACAGLKR